jgi:DnaJ-class molecular chaperone
MPREITCPRCGGSDSRCDLCNGTGKVTESQIRYADMIDKKMAKFLKSRRK